MIGWTQALLSGGAGRLSRRMSYYESNKLQSFMHNKVLKLIIRGKGAPCGSLSAGFLPYMFNKCRT